jgi:hypothetical protein
MKFYENNIIKNSSRGFLVVIETNIPYLDKLSTIILSYHKTNIQSIIIKR